MSELAVIIRVQTFFILHMLIILTIGVLMVKIFTTKDKKGVGFLIIIYLIYAVRMGLDLIMDYFKLNYPNRELYDTIYSYVMYIVPLFFTIKYIKILGKFWAIFFGIEGLILNFFVTWFLMFQMVDIIFSIVLPLILLQHFSLFLIAMNYLIKHENK